MRALIGYLVFNVLPALAALSYTLYLTRIVNNPVRLKEKMHKSAGTPKHKLYNMIYNKTSLYGWMCIAGSFSFSFFLDFYEALYSKTAFTVMLGLVAGVGLLIAGLVLIGRANKR